MAEVLTTDDIADLVGRANDIGMAGDTRLCHLIKRIVAELDRLRAERDHPETADFVRGVQLEASHQRERWKADDPQKTPADWFWLIGYLAGKGLHAQVDGNLEKARHHAITTAAACANWHRSMDGDSKAAAS